MIAITFPDGDTEKKALGILLGRFSGRVLKSGEHLVPEAALAVLADQNIPYTVIPNSPLSEEDIERRMKVSQGRSLDAILGDLKP